MDPMPHPFAPDGAAPGGAASANEALAAALERLPQASGAVWLRGLLGVVITVLLLAAWAFVATADGLAVSSGSDAEALHLAGRQVFLAERLAARALSADGVFVACEQAAQYDRVRAAARAAGLALVATVPVVPRAGKEPLFAVHVMRRAPGAEQHLPPLVVRDAYGARTSEFLRVRDAMGLPP